jgi:hypothetical protein
MEILDTQIVSHALKGRKNVQVRGKSISSITADEFLLVQSSNPVQANYYLPLPSNRHFSYHSGFGSSLNVDHPFKKTTTDQVIIDFGNQYPTVIEYGNLAASLVINNGISPLFVQAIKFLDKEHKKTLRRRFNFILESQIKCISLTREFVKIGLLLLEAFTKDHTLKSNFRNSWNDMLILGTAIGSSAALITEDSLLNRFASETFAGRLRESGKLITIDFKDSRSAVSFAGLESKRYINQPWQVKFRKYGNQ